MPGKFFLCLLYALYNNYTDWKSYCLHNRPFVLFFLLSLFVNVIANGVPGLKNALAGGAVMLCLLPLFALRAMGAGDIKVMMAIGTMLGFPMSLWFLAFSILCAGVLAGAMMLMRKNVRKRFRLFADYLKSCYLMRKILPYPQENKLEDGIFRFSFGMTTGLLIQSAAWYIGAL